MKKPLFAVMAALLAAASRVIAVNPADVEKSSADAARSFEKAIQSVSAIVPVPPHPIIPPHPAPAPHPIVPPHPAPAPQPHPDPDPHPIVPPHPWPWPPFIPPHNNCQGSGQSCSGDSDCCSGQCGSGLCQ
jgi:hypothetical protein